MMLMGRNVPARNIIGNVTMFPITPAVSGFLVTVPTSIPKEAKSVEPRTRKGTSQTVNVMLFFARAYVGKSARAIEKTDVA
jgi:hypothetical protein